MSNLVELEQAAAAYFAAGLPWRALEVWMHAAAACPEDLGLRTRVGDLYFQLGQVPHAVECYRAVAGACAARGDLVQAMAACQTILRMDPSHTEIQQALADLYARHAATAGPVTVTTPAAPRVVLFQSIDLPAEPLELVKGIELTPDSPPVVGAPLATGTVSVDPGTLPRVPLFSELSRNAFVWLLERLELHRFQAGDVIATEGDFGDSLFIVASGRVRVEKQQPDGAPVVVASLESPAFLGEIALLGSGVRSASILADAPAEILELTRETLDQLVQLYPSVKTVMRRFYRERLLADLVRTSPLLQPLSAGEREDLLSRFKETEVERGTRLQVEGKVVDGLYVVLHGCCQVSRKAVGRRVIFAELREGDTFGASSFLTGEPALTTVTARQRSTVLRLPARSARELLAARPHVAELVRVSEEAGLRELADSVKVSVANPGAPADERHAHLQGDLAKLRPSSLLVFFEMERMTGVLHLQAPGVDARVFVDAGRIVDVEAPDPVEHPVAFATRLLGLERGAFRFSFDPVTREDRLRTSTTGLLLEAARLQDEATRDVGA